MLHVFRALGGRAKLSEPPQVRYIALGMPDLQLTVNTRVPGSIPISNLQLPMPWVARSKTKLGFEDNADCQQRSPDYLYIVCVTGNRQPSYFVASERPPKQRGRPVPAFLSPQWVDATDPTYTACNTQLRALRPVPKAMLASGCLCL